MRNLLPVMFMVILAVASVTSCNAPPGYAKAAETILTKEGYSPEFIKQFTWYKPLPEAELRKFATYDSIAILHLVGGNPNTPLEVLESLADHKSFEVHTGVVSNPNAPLDLLMRLRTKGKYTTVNATMTRNAQIPTEILQEMWDNGESAGWAISSNPNCPVSIMREILNTGNDTALAMLARNPNLSDDMIQRLAGGSTPVTTYLRVNPAYKDWRARQESAGLEDPE